MDLDTSLLFQGLIWIVSGGGAGVLAYFLMEKIPAFANLSSEGKRYASVALAALCGIGAFLVAIVMLYRPEPETWRQWVEQLFAAAFVSVTTSQVIHGRAKLHQSS